MQSYPFTSQVTYDDEGLPLYDRAVDSSLLRRVFAQYFSDGIFYKPTSALQVVADTGMQVKVSPGCCHIQGAIGIEDAQRTLVVQAAESLDRIDTVVARLDLSLAARDIDLYILKGASRVSPQPPELTRDATVWELGLANLFVAKNTQTISQQRITDTRLDSSRCGLVAQTIGALDTDPYYAQLSAMIDDLREVIAGIEAGSEVMLKAAYGGSADGVVAAADKLAAPVSIGNAEFDGSADLTLEEMGAMAADAIIPIKQGGTGATSGAAALNALGMYYKSKIFTTDSSGRFSETGLLSGNGYPIFCVATVGGGGNGWVKLDDPAANKISGIVYRPDGTALTSSAVRINMIYGTSWPT